MNDPQRIRFEFLEGRLVLTAQLNASATARAVRDALPLEGRVHRWGDEIYFDCPLQLPLEPDACEELTVGAVAYWPEGPALCLFFGPTPVSAAGEPRAYSAVNVLGRILDDPRLLKEVPAGSVVRLKAA